MYSDGMATKMTLQKVTNFLGEYNLKLIGQYVSIKTKVEVLCLSCNEKSDVTIESMKKRKNSGCEKCARKKQASLSEVEAVKTMREKGLEPLEPWVGFKTLWLCRCLVCDREVRLSRDSIRRRSLEFKGCIDCAKKAQSSRMVEANKEKVLQRFEEKNLRLKSVYVNSRLPVEVECLTCGYTFMTEGLRIGTLKYGCAKCAGNYVDPVEAEDFMKSKGFEPASPFPGSHKSWESIHVVCGNTVTPEYSSIKSGNGGCKFCAEYGFQYSKPAYLYLITNQELNAHKIGIANPAKIKKSDRLHRYQHHGWLIFKVWNFPNGKLAEDIENTVLLHLRVSLEIPSYLSIQEMSGQGGHTETVSADSISLLELERLIVDSIKIEQKKIN